MAELALDSLALDEVWTADRVWFDEGPLVLVRSISVDRTSVKARLDLDKHAFIDPTPFPASGELVSRLVGAIHSVRVESRGPSKLVATV